MRRLEETQPRVRVSKRAGSTSTTGGGPQVWSGVLAYPIVEGRPIWVLQDDARVFRTSPVCEVEHDTLGRVREAVTGFGRSTYQIDYLGRHATPGA